MDELRKGIAIGMLFGSGSGSGNLMEKTATENGVYTAAEEIDPETGEIFDPPKDGYSVFTVDLALDDKSVSLTTSQITSSQTAEFEYDPHDENPELEGYSLFTIDLSAVKTDIEDLQQTIDDINQLLEEDDPDYDPTTDDPVQQVNNVIEEKDQKEQEAEECEECRAEVIAKMQEYDPDFDPQTCKDMVDEIDKIANEHDGYEFPIGTPIDPILELVAGDPVMDEDSDLVIRWGFQTIARDGSGLRPLHLDRLSYTLSSADGPDSSGYIGFRVLLRVYQSDGTYITEHQLPFEYTGTVGDVLTIDSRSIDYTNGRTKFKGYKNGSLLEQGSYDYYNNDIIGYGDPSHTKKVRNS